MKINKGRNEIPDLLYQELVELFGYEQTEEYLNTSWADYRWLSFLVIRERFRRRYGVDLRLVIFLGMLLILILSELL